MRQCRYLDYVDGRPYCVYWDLGLRDGEEVGCRSAAWQCYEEPGGCIFEGRWMTLREYAEHLRAKHERELPEGYELQEFRLDREGLAELLSSAEPHSPQSVSAEFRYLKMRPEYPHGVRMIAIAHFHRSAATGPSAGESSGWPHWVAALRIAGASCEVSLTVILKDGTLHVAEAFCAHGSPCGDADALRRAALESAAFGAVRADLERELFQRELADACTEQDRSSGDARVPRVLDDEL